MGRRLLETWDPMTDAENMTFESVAAEQALQRQAADLATAYMGHTPKDEKPLTVEVAAQAPPPWSIR